MDRLACVDVRAFPLQLLLRRHADWARHPAAVVDRDSPQGVLLWVNEIAWRQRIRPGLRYTAGLSIARELRAEVVAPSEIEAGTEEIQRWLSDFSPEVEASREHEGVFWLDAAGLERIEPSLLAWARRIHARLRSERLAAAVVVGFARFQTYVAARDRPEPLVFENERDEAEFVRRVHLGRLDVAPKLIDALTKLGVETIGDFLKLPAAGVRDRFGNDAYRLHRLAAGRESEPLQPAPLLEPIEETIRFDFVVTNVTTLLFAIKRSLPDLLARLAGRGLALADLVMRFGFERSEPRAETLKPAFPTLDVALLLNLIILRLETIPWRGSGNGSGSGGVEEIVLVARGEKASREQLRLFLENPRRDLVAAERAIARLRARFGEPSVLTAHLKDAHLPEAGFFWKPLHRLALPSGRLVLSRPLMRRIRQSVLPLSPRRRHERDDGWVIHDVEHGAVLKCVGPYVISGGWWGAAEVHREYHYAVTTRGALLWVYFDRPRRRWFLQGEVE